MLGVPITAVGISHHLVQVEELAELSRVSDRVAIAIDEDPRLLGRVVLSTCNRFEVYFESNTFHSSLEAVLATISAALPPSSRGIVEQFEIYPGQSAVQHLLEVASGLDAMVIGEAEIIGQVREAIAGAGRFAGATLTRLFHAALTTAKAVASGTDLGAAGRSIATVGLDLVERRHFPLAGRSVLLVGTGSYARVVTAALNRRGCTDLAVYSPSGRAGQFATTHPIKAIPSDGLAAAIAATDLLVTCSGRPANSGPVIGVELLASSRPAAATLLPVLDFALTGDVDPAAGALLGVDLIDLEEIGAHAPAEQAASILAARDLITRGVDTYLHLEQGRAATPAVTAMRAHVSQFIESEIEAAGRRHDPETAAAVARSLRRVSNALLHTPSLRAAELARSGELADYSHALQTLFGIEVQADA